MQGEPTDITSLLRQWQAGDSHAYDLVMSWAYQRMLAIATGFVAHERLATEPAALVNEAYLRLRKLRHMEWQDRNHFFAVVAGELRRILIDQARQRIAQKREGSQQRVPLSDDLSWIDARGQDMLDLDRALDELEQVDAGKVRLVELRYVMGCTVSEICSLQGLSDATVERHLRFARTWLYDRLHSASV
ncbi:MAG TPA: ECF-type sigma factor [Bryobacteraceae bacterium]|nr:ECF-type sigma factor [Bryobacteraceae bacterium]